MSVDPDKLHIIRSKVCCTKRLPMGILLYWYRSTPNLSWYHIDCNNSKLVYI